MFERLKTVLLAMLVVAIPGLPMALVLDKASGGKVSHAMRVVGWQAERAAHVTGVSAWVSDRKADWQERQQSEPVPDDSWSTDALRNVGEELGRAADGSGPEVKENSILSH